MIELLDVMAIMVTSAIAAFEWVFYAERRKPRSLGFAVFTTLIAIAVMIHAS